MVGLTFFVIIGYQILCRIQSILMVRLSLRTRGRAIPGKANPGASRQRQADHFSDNHLNPAFTGNAEYGHSTSSLIAHFWESILRVEILCYSMDCFNPTNSLGKNTPAVISCVLKQGTGNGNGDEFKHKIFLG